MVASGELTVQRPEIAGHVTLRLRPNNALEPSRHPSIVKPSREADRWSQPDAIHKNIAQ